MTQKIKLGTGEYIEAAPYRTSSDAFGRLRSANPETLFDSKFVYDKMPSLWDEKIHGAGTSTYDQSNACINMTVSGSSQSVTRQTKSYFNYRTGKSQLFVFTGILGSAVSNLTRRIGAFDSNNGLFFELQDSTLSVVVRKNGTDTKISQSSWNIDKLDGTSDSRITLDLSRVQIFVIDYQWLGAGQVRFGFYIDDRLHYCHAKYHANRSTSVYTSNPNYPIRYEISSTGGSGTLVQICSSAMSEGSADRFYMYSDSTTNAVNCNTVGQPYAVLGLRLKSDRLTSSARIYNVAVLSLTNDSFKWSLCLNPSVSGVITYTDASGSSVEVGRTNGGNPSTEIVYNYGIKLMEGYGSIDSQSSNIEIDNFYKLGCDISGIRDTIFLVVTPYSANADIHGAITWKELV